MRRLYRYLFVSLFILFLLPPVNAQLSYQLSFESKAGLSGRHNFGNDVLDESFYRPLTTKNRLSYGFALNAKLFKDEKYLFDVGLKFYSIRHFSTMFFNSHQLPLLENDGINHDNWLDYFYNTTNYGINISKNILTTKNINFRLGIQASFPDLEFDTYNDKGYFEFRYADNAFEWVDQTILPIERGWRKYKHWDIGPNIMIKFLHGDRFYTSIEGYTGLIKQSNDPDHTFGNFYDFYLHFGLGYMIVDKLN